MTLVYYIDYTKRVKMRQTFRFYPNSQQQIALNKEFGCSRYAYNWALSWWGQEFKNGNKPNYAKCSRQWTIERNSKQWAMQASCIAQQQSVRQLQTAFRSFFDKRTKYPTFKKKAGRQTAQYTRSGFKYDPKTQTLKIAKIGVCKIHLSRKFQSAPTVVTITKQPSGKYFATFTLDEVIHPKANTGKQVGIDLGVTRLATFSDGTKIPNPKHIHTNAKKLAKAQKDLARKTIGSNRYTKQRIKLAKIHEHIANSRKDHLNKVTTKIVENYDLIAIEDLPVRNMVKDHHLAKSISDASFGEFRRQLAYKCEWYGKELIAIDRFFPSSKTCNNCGWIVEKLPLSVRQWQCHCCDALHDRDLNASINILAAGHVASGRGLDVRLATASVVESKLSRSVNPGSGETLSFSN